MKKIIYTLLVAVLALSFMGCPSVYEDLKFEEKVPTPAYIQGDMTDNKAVAMEVDGDVATYTFKYSVKDHNAWDGEPGTVNFKVSPEKDGDGLNWPLAWSNAKLTLNGEAVVVTEQNTSNISCSGLADGEEYTIKVTAGVKSVKIEVTGKEGEIVLPTPYYLEAYFISGDMNEWANDGKSLLWNPTLDKLTGVLTYQYTFKATNTTHNFGIRNNTSDWKIKYVDGKFAFGTNKDYVPLVKHDDGKGTNNEISGLTIGNDYRMYIQVTPEGKVSFKVVLLNTANIKVNVTGLPDEANGKVMYLTGDYFDWKEPGDGNASIKGTVVDGAVSYSFDYIYEGTTFELKFTGKAAAAGWKKPEISGPDGKDASFTVNQEKTTVTVTYVETKEITSADTDVEKDWGLQYRCKWEVK